MQWALQSLTGEPNHDESNQIPGRQGPSDSSPLPKAKRAWLLRWAAESEPPTEQADAHGPGHWPADPAVPTSKIERNY